MLYQVFLALHFTGIALLGGGLVFTDVILRQARRTTDVQRQAFLYNTLHSVAYLRGAVPGGLLMGLSGLGMIGLNGWHFFASGWLVGMWALYLFEFLDGIFITEPYLRKLARVTQKASDMGVADPLIDQMRQNRVHRVLLNLDTPVFFLIVLLGALRPF
jgi:uncharacterized membrane protein